MQFVNIHDTKTNLSKYLRQISATQQPLTICKNGHPIAQLTPYQKPTKNVIGLLQGQIYIADDFDTMPEEFLRHFQ